MVLWKNCATLDYRLAVAQGGLLRAGLTAALPLAHGDDKLPALEIVEYNPYLDEHFVTAHAIHDLRQSLVP